jgi:hypothetical protein
MGRVWLAALAGVGLFGLPDLANACPVCSPGDDESRTAFLMTTAFLTALPLTVLGGAIGFLRWRYLQLRRNLALRPPVPRPTPRTA